MLKSHFSLKPVRNIHGLTESGMFFHDPTRLGLEQVPGAKHLHF